MEIVKSKPKVLLFGLDWTRFETVWLLYQLIKIRFF